ncbi:hypothetical protein [Alloacidobacterium sp.]|uniref:hypothetical protein n=1 Tax=Alloacidobacterium sp. TaxID=2951999 RepID=UPI002D32E655|nr:hypothetical protein [Alloacidobacterium sp.]HYK36296.1 hypothetical protein [Alloacidobacterium sp.]
MESKLRHNCIIMRGIGLFVSTFFVLCSMFGQQSANPPSKPDRLISEARMTRDIRLPQAILIGFVGGFVKSDDRRHQEVQFAAHIRYTYPGYVHAEVFGNHQRTNAFKKILFLLDTDHNGILTAAEKQQAKILIYGHSWGAAETLKLARELGRDEIPVQLTVQIDSIAKPGQDDSTVPSNVAKAVNFYQSHGLLHGVQTIRAADPTHTKILGNFQMTYKNYRVNCDTFPWRARIFTKPHIEIENDPRVWDQISSLIDEELVTTGARMSIPSH